MKDKYYNPNYLYLSGREYIVLEELENGRKKIKFLILEEEKSLTDQKIWMKPIRVNAKKCGRKKRGELQQYITEIMIFGK